MKYAKELEDVLAQYEDLKIYDKKLLKNTFKNKINDIDNIIEENIKKEDETLFKFIADCEEKIKIAKEKNKNKIYEFKKNEINILINKIAKFSNIKLVASNYD